MSLPRLNPDEILRAEYDYIAQCAFQANEDRARVASFYFVSVGSLVAAILGSQFAGGKMSNLVYLAFGLLFLMLTFLGVLTVLQLARLRAAWNSAAEAMNTIKKHYIKEHATLDDAIIWKELPKADKWFSISNLMRIQVGLLSSTTFAAAAYTLLRTLYSELPWWGWIITIASPIIFYYLEWLGYHKMLLKK